MRDKPTTSRALIAVLTLAVGFGTATVGQTRTSSNGQLALVGGTIHVSPSDDPIRDGVLLIRGGRIAAVGSKTSVRMPPGIETIDCAGLTIAAGFWNSHVHFLQRKWSDVAGLPAAELDRQVQDMLTRYGFTSVFDTWSIGENTRRLRDRIEAGEIPGPRIRSTGEAMFAKGVATTAATWGALGFMPLEGFQTARVADAAEAHEAAKKLLDAGADGLKIYAVTPGRNGVALPESAIQASVEEAHNRGKPVFAHPTTTAGLLASVHGGVDVLTHTTPQSGPWDERVLGEMKLAAVALVPTLKLWSYELRHERASLGDGLRQTAIGQLRAWQASGGTVLFGTDVGYMSEYDPTDEYALMAEAGMGFRQILASLTTAPAERFGASTQLGRIAPGLVADLTILKNDPSTDIRALAAVQYTLRDGRIIYRAAR